MGASTTSEQGGEGHAAHAAPGARVVAALPDLAAPILAAVGVELDRVEYALGGGKPVLRVFLDKAGGVGLEDCAEVSRQLSVALDDADLVRGAFVLEVSSPGLTRPLRGEADFRRFAGRWALVHAKAPIAGKRREALGRLAGFEDGCVLLDESKSGERLRVPLDQIAKARLEIES